MRNPEIHLGKGAESVHCIAMFLPHIKFINKPTVSNEYLPTPHRLGASCLECKYPVRTVD
jgi:hypothetical protein